MTLVFLSIRMDMTSMARFCLTRQLQQNAWNFHRRTVGEQERHIVGIFPGNQALRAVGRRTFARWRAELERGDKLLLHVIAVGVFGANAAPGKIKVAIGAACLADDELVRAMLERNEPGFSVRGGR